jgi:hypothetical protein
MCLVKTLAVLFDSVHIVGEKEYVFVTGGAISTGGHQEEGLAEVT